MAVHLSLSVASSWNSQPVLPSKSCRTTSALVSKFYVATGLALHIMHTADVLKDLDERAGVTSEAVKELRQASDLVL